MPADGRWDLTRRLKGQTFNDAGQLVILGSPVLTRLRQRDFLFASPSVLILEQSFIFSSVGQAV